MRKYYIGITILSFFVGLVIIGGIIQTGGPFSAKNIKLDEERINNFKEISLEVRSIYNSSGKIPSSLQSIVENKVSTNKLKIKDPETDKIYEYVVISPTSFNLCTTFSTDSREISEKYEDYYFYDSYANKMKNHKKGQDCITYSVISSPNDSYSDENYDDYDNNSDDYDSVIYEEDEDLDYIVPTVTSAPVKSTMITPNFKWRSNIHSADISISKAYITNSDIGSIDENKNDKKIFIEFNVINRGTNKIIYPKQLASLIAERDANGVLTYPIAYQGYDGSAVSANTMYGAFLPPAFTATNVYELSVGDPGKEQTLNLDFTNATEVVGSFDINKGFVAE